MSGISLSLRLFSDTFSSQIGKCKSTFLSGHFPLFNDSARLACFRRYSAATIVTRERTSGKWWSIACHAILLSTLHYLLGLITDDYSFRAKQSRARSVLNSPSHRICTRLNAISRVICEPPDCEVPFFEEPSSSFFISQTRNSVGFMTRAVKRARRRWIVSSHNSAWIREASDRSTGRKPIGCSHRVWLTFCRLCLGIVAFVGDDLRGGYKRSRATICRCALSRDGVRAYASRWDITPNNNVINRATAPECRVINILSCLA